MTDLLKATISRIQLLKDTSNLTFLNNTRKLFGKCIVFCPQKKEGKLYHSFMTNFFPTKANHANFSIDTEGLKGFYLIHSMLSFLRENIFTYFPFGSLIFQLGPLGKGFQIQILSAELGYFLTASVTFCLLNMCSNILLKIFDLYRT